MNALDPHGPLTVLHLPVQRTPHDIDNLLQICSTVVELQALSMLTQQSEILHPAKTMMKVTNASDGLHDTRPPLQAMIAAMPKSYPR